MDDIVSILERELAKAKEDKRPILRLSINEVEKVLGVIRKLFSALNEQEREDG